MRRVGIAGGVAPLIMGREKAERVDYHYKFYTMGYMYLYSQIIDGNVDGSIQHVD